MQIKRVASTNKNYPFLIGYWLRGHATTVTCTWILRVFKAFMVAEAGFEAAGMH